MLSHLVRRNRLRFSIPAILIAVCALVTVRYSRTVRAQASAPAFGQIEAQFTVDRQGAAVYHIPIEVPPGTSELEPDLELVYSSQVGNGKAGMGFSLSGLASIARCAPTVMQDGFRAGITYTSSDRFCIDGARLMVVKGQYGQDGSVYHTEKESWAKIEAIGTCGSGPCSFRVTDTDGTENEYGFTPDSRVLRQGGPDVRVWTVNRITDTNHNYLTVSYKQENGEYYPVTILYTGNSSAAPELKPQRAVTFEYESRTDPSTTWTAGAAVTTAQRLKRITTCVSASGSTISTCAPADRVLEYSLNYDYGPATHRSRLRSLEVCGGPDNSKTCYRPTTFDWQSQGGGYQTKAVPIPGPLYVIAGQESYTDGVLYDINSDGIADYSNATEFPKRQASDLEVYFGTPDHGWVDAGFKLPGPLYRVVGSTIVNAGILTDINGDGIPDYCRCTYFTSSGKSDLAVWLGTGTGFEQHKEYQVPGPVFIQIGDNVITTGVLEDLDGDGIADYSRASWIKSTNQKLLEIYRGTGTGFTNTGKLLPGPVYLVDTNTSQRIGLLEDFNNDGIIDYSAALVDYDNNGKKDLAVHIGFYGFTYKPLFNLPDGVFFKKNNQILQSGIVQDINGDGVPDYSRATQLLNPPSNLLAISWGTGLGYSASPQNLPGPLFVVSGDSSVDMGALESANGTDVASYTRGTRWIRTGKTDLSLHTWSAGGFKPAGFDLPGPLFISDDSATYTSGLLQDVNGDSLADYVDSTCHLTGDERLGDCKQNVRLANEPLSDLLSTITNGLNGVYTMSYAPITHGAIYNKARNNSPAGINVQWPFYVISSYRMTTAKSPSDPGYAAYSYDYRYEGARVNNAGEGFLGFEKMSTTDHQLGITTTTTYHQQFPLDQTIESQRVTRASDSKLLSETIYSQSSVSTYPGVYLVHVDSEEMHNFDLAGKSIVARTTYRYDRYGNMTFVDRVDNVTDPNNHLYICQTFENSEAPWRIGFQVDKIEAKAITTNASGEPQCDKVLSWSRTEYDAGTMDEKNKGDWDNTPRQNTATGIWITKTYKYDTFGNIVSVTDPLGTITSVVDPVYHTFTNTLTNAAGLTTEQTHDARFDVLLTEKDPNGHTTINKYDDLGRRISLSGPNQDNTATVELQRFTWGEENGKLYESTAQRVDWAGAVWDERRSYIDGLDRAYETRADGPTPGKYLYTTRKYDTETRVVFQSLPYFSAATPVGTSTEYDIFGRLRKSVAPDGSVTDVTESIEPVDGITYFRVAKTEGFGTPEARTTLSYLDRRGNVFRMVYPKDSNQTVDPVVVYSRDPLDNVTKITAPGATTDIEYDSLERIRSIENSSAGRRTFFFDEKARLAEKTNARGQTIRYTYDAIYRPTSMTLPEGDVIYFQYDEAARTNGKDEITTIRAVKSGSEAYRFEYSYDNYENSNIISKTLGGRTYDFARTFDAAGHMIQLTYPDGATTRARYTLNGSLEAVERCSKPDVNECTPADWITYIQYQDFNSLNQPGKLNLHNNVNSEYTYDKAGKIATSKTNSPGGVLLENVYKWNSVLNITNIDDKTSNGDSEAYEYTPQGYLKKATGPYGVLEYTYDLSGNRKSRKDSQTGAETLYEYDGLRLTRATVNGHPVYSATYDADGNVHEQTTSRGLNFTFNSQNYLTSICEAPCSSTSSNAGLYEYDFSGRRQFKTDPDGTRTVYVDEAYIVTIKPDRTEQHTSFVSGSAGDLMSIEKPGKSVHYWRPTPHKPAANRRGSAGPIIRNLRDRTYRLLTDPMLPFISLAVAWLLANAVFVISLLRSASPQTRLAKVRDLLLLALARSRLPGLCHAAGQFKPPPDRPPIAEFSSNPWRLLWPAAMFAALLLVISPETLEAQQRPAAPSKAVAKTTSSTVEEILYFTQNQVDSVVLATDATGAVVSRVVYRPFGEIYQSASHGEKRLREKFVGNELDDSSGLYYFGARYYNPETGRFMSADQFEPGGPELSAASYNLYSYSENNPITYNDPSGEFVEIIIAIVIGAVIGAYIGAAAVNGTMNPLNWDWTSGKTYLGLAAGAAIGGVGGAVSAGTAAALGGGITANIIAGATAGALENAAYSALAGDPPEDLLLNGLTGALLGGVGGGIASAGGRPSSALRSTADAQFESPRGFRAAMQECLCFTEGTVVATTNGLVPIENVQVGDQVWSSPELPAPPQPHTVNELFERISKNAVDVQTSSGDTIRATPEHKFWVDGRGWTRAVDLRTGDHLLTRDGVKPAVSDLTWLSGTFRVHNFEVSSTHTYYVGTSGILVHNPSKCAKPKKAKDPFDRATFRKGTLNAEWNSAKAGTAAGSKQCPTCKKDVFKLRTSKRKGKPVKKKGWDSDHTGATWAKRVEYMKKLQSKTGKTYTRKQILNEYNRNTRLQCHHCNRGHQYEPGKTDTANYLKTIQEPK